MTSRPTPELRAPRAARAPAWLAARSAPQRLDWPVTRSLPVHNLYADLAQRLAVSREVDRAVREWSAVAIDRIVEVIRPHAFDVDGRLCGSVACGTHVAGADWDIDVAVRIHTPHAEWKAPDHAVGDIQRWVADGLGVAVTTVGESLILPGSESRRVRIIPCWRQPSGAWSTFLPFGEQRRDDHPLDPVGHRDLLLARDRSLAGGSLVCALIRLIKALNGRWARAQGDPPLRSFEIELLALAYCSRPMSLAEAVPGFLAASAPVCWKQARRDSGSRPRAQAEAVRSLLTEAAALTERALMTPDAVEARDILTEVFGEKPGQSVNDSSGPDLGEVELDV